MQHQVADYIIVGGGISGCVVASRLSKHKSKPSVVLIEAGPDAARHPLVSYASTAQRVRNSELNWNFPSTKQQHLDGRICQNAAGKALGGSSAINTGGWIRGDAKDYDYWAKIVNNPRWSYSGFLPYFIKTEHHHDPSADPTQHGFKGPIHTQTALTTGRHYPLREPAKVAFAAIGINEIRDANSGSPQGLAQCTEAWNNGKRQLASEVYPLDSVNVLTETMVERVLIEDKDGEKIAVAVQLADGRILQASREVILCAGAYRTPQVLLLSGIGSNEELTKHGIQQVIDLPDVGKNLHDHFAVSQYWKLHAPGGGLAFGDPKFNTPAYSLGLPFDWVATETVPAVGLKDALLVDAQHADDMDMQLNQRSHLELYLVYAGASAKPVVTLDGSHVMTSVVMLLPTSRGQVTISSTNPNDNPVIDNNYYATEHDRYVMRIGLKKIGKMLHETREGQEIVANEVVAEGLEPLTSTLSDANLDARVRFSGNTLYHPAGTASMGKVVDSELRVRGISRLRVADASVLPVPIASHYQACIFALGEQAADLLLT
ncbi:putative GMC-type oxidoreductase [Lachnellula arida]|uniref:Putative GMC-type oxidoreductase n=1 Tax=Lachnellula arida TaxID=1316785 RepID=A0A8T9BBI5_9HELO|nr:putative GMC-type oxidoreductase [Lachnellula arida]